MKAALSIRIVLSSEAIAKLRLPVNGQGGFQSLLRSIQGSLGESNELVLTAAQAGRIARYVNKYGGGGFQGRLSFVLDELRALAKLLEPMAA